MADKYIPDCPCWVKRYYDPHHTCTSDILLGYYNVELDEWWNPGYEYCPGCGKPAKKEE